MAEVDAKKTLDDNTKQELNKALWAHGLEALVGLMAGANAGIIMFAWGIVRGRIDKMRELALAQIQKRYPNERIEYVGQQVAGMYPEKECWAFVQRVGGTLWVQNVYLTEEDGLSNVLFWSPSNKLQLAKGIALRVYRGSTMCEVNQDGPAFRSK